MIFVVEETNRYEGLHSCVINDLGVPVCFCRTRLEAEDIAKAINLAYTVRQCVGPRDWRSDVTS